MDARFAIPPRGPVPARLPPPIMPIPQPFVDGYPTDTEAGEPFAPAYWRALRDFDPEPVSRAILVRGCLLEAVGLLYPSATFGVVRFPASQNRAVRLSGTGLSRFASLVPKGTLEVEKYVLLLIRRDWPTGTVAMMAWDENAATLARELQDAFDVIPGEIWRFKPYTIRDERGVESRMVKVMRGFQGSAGPVEARVLEEHFDRVPGTVPEDSSGRTMELLTYDVERSNGVGAGAAGQPRVRTTTMVVHREHEEEEDSEEDDDEEEDSSDDDDDDDDDDDEEEDGNAERMTPARAARGGRATRATRASTGFRIARRGGRGGRGLQVGRGRGA